MNAAKRLLHWVGPFPSRLLDLVAWTPLTLSAATLHVWLQSPDPRPPYDTWATAATNIQHAVNAAQPGDTVLVTNGVYATGRGTVPTNLVATRVVVNQPITVRSVHGPEWTIIVGFGGTTDTRAIEPIRCVFLADGAVLSGFTLTRGVALPPPPSLDPIWNGPAAHCVGGGVLCASTNAVVTNCVLTGSLAAWGGGAYGGTLYNCRVTGNAATQHGGGVSQATLYNSVLTGNSADAWGGGAAESALYHCTVTGNSSTGGGAGIAGGTSRNCIVYFNRAPRDPNYSEGTALEYSCTTPLPTNGLGNLDLDPQLATTTHLASDSPCIGAGNPDFTRGVDIDGNPWANPPAIGADQPQGAGPLALRIESNFTTVAPGFPLTLTAHGAGALLRSVWDFGDGTTATNQAYVVHSWPRPGTYRVTLTGYNDDFPLGTGVVSSVIVSGVAHYVNLASPRPAFPFTRWETAATNIQDAIAAANVTGATVWVTNGVYRSGGVSLAERGGPSRVALTNTVLVQSVHGPQVTVIEGQAQEGPVEGIRCAYVGNGSVLSGFTLTKGQPSYGGGGVYCDEWGVVTNCVVTANSGGGGHGGTYYDCAFSQNSGQGVEYATLHRCVLAENSGSGASSCQLYDCRLTGNRAYSGGGAQGGTLRNCVLENNQATESGGGANDATLYGCLLRDNSAHLGGGASGSTLFHCTVIGNSADQGGGVDRSKVYNSIVHGNRAPVGANYHWEDWFSPIDRIIEYSCVSPLPPGPGNLDLDPRLASPSHLSADSPCRAAGSPAYAVGTDFDGEAWANPPSMGCDEFIPGQVTGPLGVVITAASTQALVGEPLRFAASIEGRTTRSLWDFGEGLLVTNQPYVVHSWTVPGDYPITLRADNESHPEGVTATVTVQVFDAAVHYVDAASRNPVPPYRTWDTAATTIQDAVDAVTVAGATVWVTNGLYATGGRPIRPGRRPNRVVVDKPITLRSVHGADVTTIRGAQPGTEPNTPHGVRCVYLAEGATLSGFTLTRGSAEYLYGEGFFADTPDDLRGGAVWAPPSRATVTHCLLTDNAAAGGGAAFGGAFYLCTFTGNTAGQGGAACRSLLEDCTLSGNWALGMEARGGGAYECTLRRCLLSDNRAHWFGGGVHASQLDHCTLIGNQAPYGGGASGSTLRVCRITGNEAFERGGGAGNCSLYQCTVTGNSAREGGGLAVGRAYNSIVYFNRAERGEPNYFPNFFWFESGFEFEYSCTTPLPPGAGNIDRDPGLATATHLSADSPCVGAGLPAYADGVDIDGDPWATPPAMGADQPGPGPAPSPLTVWIEAPFRRALPGNPLSFIAHNTGRIGSTVWDFGDGTTLTNQGFVTRAWAKPGVYPLSLTGYGEAFPGGVVARLSVAVTDAPSYVDPNNPHPSFPYTTWETAATNLQDAIASAASVGTRIWVTNGVYRTGVTRVTYYEYSPIDLLSRVALSNAVVLQSVNGPEVTVIEGGPDGVRCAYVGDGSVLSGFTLTQGTTPKVVPDGPNNVTDGGGAWCPSTNALLTNCVLIGNSATGNGGGAAGGRLANCRLTGNTAGGDGGGAFGSDLFHCLVTRNSAGGNGGGVRGRDGPYPGGTPLFGCTIMDNSALREGGGVHTSQIYDSIIRGNRAPVGPNYHWEVWISPVNRIIEHSCVSPLSPGPGNLDSDPRFVNVDAGDFRLRPDSPCIDAGTQAWGPVATDLLGIPRVLDGNADGVARVDLGAYEFDPAIPFITRAEITPTGLRLEWLPAAQGARLQRTIRLAPPDWIEVPGTETMTGITLPANDATGFYRLVRP